MFNTEYTEKDKVEDHVFTINYPNGIPKPQEQLTGWLCPACGKGNSPFSSSCDCVNWDSEFYCNY